MLFNFIRFILGYVKFSFIGGFADDFLNNCYAENINIKQIVYDNNALYAQADIKSYRKLHRVAFKCGGKVKIIQKKGLPFILAPLKNRWGIFAGILFFVFLFLLWAALSGI